ncbi:DUF397 domain-containing protein [Streptomyces sp. NPDC053079]|uniref:DUF397 domain-containing protein n=1 Tax=Streptomyces sp. NPDC053079 TaxID=3365697 RepID=UPI0037D0595A
MIVWQKSSYCSEGNACLGMGALVQEWQKSSHSASSSNCVNVAALGDGTVRLRESDDPDTILAVPPTALRAFLRTVKAGLGGGRRTA